MGHKHIAKVINYTNANLLIQEALNSGIVSNIELSNFMGQMEEESGGFAHMEENIKGYSAHGLLKVFHKRISSLNEAQLIIDKGQESLANFLYGEKDNPTAQNLGNIHEGDGWNYRGRGFVQLTGRDNYRIFGKKVGLDLVKHPELAANLDNALKIAVAYWKNRVVRHHDELDVNKASYDLNKAGGHLIQRKQYANEWQQRFNDGYLEKNNLIPHNTQQQRQNQQIQEQQQQQQQQEMAQAQSRSGLTIKL